MIASRSFWVPRSATAKSSARPRGPTGIRPTIWSGAGSSSAKTIALGSSADEGEMQAIYEQYVAKYGQDNADYLMEVMGAWQKHYSRAAYIQNIEMPMPDYRQEIREVAGRRGWRFEQLEGRLLIIRDLVEGAGTRTRSSSYRPGRPSWRPTTRASSAPRPCPENGARSTRACAFRTEMSDEAGFRFAVGQE